MIYLQLFLSFLQIGMFSFGGGYAAMPLIQGQVVTCIARLYLKYRNLALLQGILNSLRPAVVALIASAGISILITAFWGSQAAVALANTNWLLVAIFAVCVVLLQKFKMNPIWVMVLAGVIKTVVSLIVSVF